MSVLNITTGQSARSGLGEAELPQLIFVPEQVYQTIKLANEPQSTLLNLDQLIQLIGPAGVASLVYVNSLYNSESGKFLPNEVIGGFAIYDLMDIYRDQLTENEHLRATYTNIVKQIDGLSLTKADLPDAFLRENVGNDMEVAATQSEQYYVPEMFVVSERIYGVRLKAVTGIVNSKDALTRTTVANLGLLSNSYDIRQIAHFDILKRYVALC